MKTRNWHLPKWLRLSGHEDGVAAPAPAPGELGVAVSHSGDRARIALVGELDLSTAPALTRRLAEAEAKGPATVEIDLRRLEFLDSTGLAVLFAANRRARAEGRRLVLLKGEGPIDRILELARVEDVIDTVQEPAAD